MSSYGLVQLSPSYITTYVASSGSFTAATNATDIAILNGSASKTIKVLKVTVTYRVTYVGGVDLNAFYLLKRSAANTSGTSTTMTNVPLDSNNSSASAVCKYYTANPSVGALVGNVNSVLGIAGGNANGTGQVVLFDADKYGQALVLRGTAQGLAVNNNGATVTGNTPLVDVTFVWTEE